MTRRFGHDSGAISRFHIRPVLFALGLLLALAFAGNALGALPVPLGDAASFGALSATAMTNAPPTSAPATNTVVNGDIGSSTSIDAGVTNPCCNRYGAGDPFLALAQASLGIAYGDAFAAPPDHSITGSNLAGQTLFPGVYSSTSSILIDGPVALKLDGNGDPNSVFIFKAVSDLTVNPTSSVTLTNGAQACNVFWQVGSSAGLLNSGFRFVGTILAHTSITLTDGITVDGRVLALIGDVTFIHDTVNTPSCATEGSAAITLTPKTATNIVGSSHTVTAHFTLGGLAGADTPVTFTVTAGPNTGQTQTVTTDGSGNATFTYTSNGVAGIDTITASAPGVSGVLTTVSDTAQKVWLAASDHTVPMCLLTERFNGNPKWIKVTVQDNLGGSGLGSIQVTTSTNADTVVPTLTGGPVVVTATKIDQSASSRIVLTVTDAAGNVVTCDPLWPGKKAAKPASRAKHQRAGRHAAGWGRRTT